MLSKIDEVLTINDLEVNHLSIVKTTSIFAFYFLEKKRSNTIFAYYILSISEILLLN